MQKLFILPALLLSVNSHANPFAPAAGQPGSTAIHMNDPAFVAWATGWVDYVPGARVDASFRTPEKALGKASGTSFDVVSLGEGGKITLTFANPIMNGPGWDFAVFENSFNDTFLELAWVEVSSNGSDFFRFDNYSYTPSPVGAFGAVQPTNIHGLAGKYRQGWGTPFDLADLARHGGLDVNNIPFIRLIDIIGDGSARDSLNNPIFDPYQTTGSAGSDLDAIGVINPVPVPAAFWLMGSALVGLIGMKRPPNGN